MFCTNEIKFKLKRLYVDCPEQDIVFNIPVIIAKKNQINAHGLKNSNCTCIIENLPFDCEFSTMKHSVDGVLYHATQITQGLSRI